VADLPIPELVENRRRSIAMLPVGAPALNRDEALEVLRQLGEALRLLRALEGGDEVEQESAAMAEAGLAFSSSSAEAGRSQLVCGSPER
jgi:hypothetical protein